MNLRTPILIFVLTSCAASQSWCDDSVAIAVIPLTNAGPDGRDVEFGEALASLLVQSLSMSHNVVLVERVELAEILREQAATSKIEALQGARALCTGSFAIKAKNLELTIRVIDVADSRVICSAAASGGVADLEKTFSRVTEQLIKGLKPSDIMPSKHPTEEKFLRANLNYAKGLGELWLGNYPAAAACFTQCLSISERHVAARFWLAQSYHKMDLNLSAKLELCRFQKTQPDSKWSGRAKQLETACTVKLTADELRDFQRIVTAD